MIQLSFALTRPRGSLLKWIGNKFKYSHIITSHFSFNFNRYFEPFVGTGAVLATVAPERGIAGDTLVPLIDLWLMLRNDPAQLVRYYEKIINRFNEDREQVYFDVLRRYNARPNGLDLLIISRTCYGGVVRFTRGGKISTPIGPHQPISPVSFSERVMEWGERIKNVTFFKQSFAETMSIAKRNDLIYCDPPYVDSQSILYGAQDFNFHQLVKEIEKCKTKGARVALSIDGKKKSGKKVIELGIPPGLFEREIFLECGSSMLKRFQNGGSIMEGEDVHERLLLTW